MGGANKFAAQDGNGGVRRVAGPAEQQFGELLRHGKVKDVHADPQNPRRLIFKFRDDISVFDQRIPTQIPQKGATLAHMSTHWFDMASDLGYSTHLVKMLAPDVMVVRKAEIQEELGAGAQRDVRGRFIPLELITRYYAAGSLVDRLRRGEADPKDFGLDHVPQSGEKLPEPIFEATTKFEKTDRPVTGEEALRIGGISKAMWNEIKEMTLQIDARMQYELDHAGLIHVDGKKEYAVGLDGRPMIVDTFGTADEDRFWDRAAYDQNPGKAPELSKELVRQYYRRLAYEGTLPGVKGNNTYHEVLMAIRDHNKKNPANKIEEPKIPALPPEFVAEVSELYKNIAGRLTGESFADYLARFDSAAATAQA